MTERAAFDGKYTRYQLERSMLRRLVRRIYLRRASKLLRGATLDFGCGVGELLARLPAGSRGLEYNEESVRYCRDAGLSVDWYDGSRDDWALSGVEGRFDSFLISHVLEHLESPQDVLEKLLRSAERLGVRRFVVIVPGKAGFRIDPTHVEFVDKDMLLDVARATKSGFELVEARYFPGNFAWLGRVLAHHELQAVFDRKFDRSQDAGGRPPVR